MDDVKINCCESCWLLTLETRLGVWSDLIINCNESLAAGGRWAWAGPDASISDGYRLHLLQGHALAWVTWGMFSFMDCGYNGSSIAAILLQLETRKNPHGTLHSEHGLCQCFPHFCFEIMLFEGTGTLGSLFVNAVFPFQVFCHLASQHLDEINSWSSDPPLIQIGGGGFNGFSQSTFLSNYETNWDLEQKDKKKKKKKKLKKVNFDTQSYINCDTKAFFLTPLKMKNVISKEKLDFRSVCKVL